VKKITKIGVIIIKITNPRAKIEFRKTLKIASILKNKISSNVLPVFIVLPTKINMDIIKTRHMKITLHTHAGAPSFRRYIIDI
jgi:hypothetical protein